MKDVLLVLLSGGVLGLLGYALGVLRTSTEERNERRDAALAEIFKEMSLFYRYLSSWTAGLNPDPNEPTGESSGDPALENVNDQYRKFAHTFYDINAIWLGKNTYDLIHGFSKASSGLLNELNDMSARGGPWRLSDGTNPDDRRKERITPQYFKIRDELRAELEASRDLILWFRYQVVKGKNALGERGTDSERESR